MISKQWSDKLSIHSFRQDQTTWLPFIRLVLLVSDNNGSIDLMNLLIYSLFLCPQQKTKTCIVASILCTPWEDWFVLWVCLLLVFVQRKDFVLTFNNLVCSSATRYRVWDFIPNPNNFLVPFQITKLIAIQTTILDKFDAIHHSLVHSHFDLDSLNLSIPVCASYSRWIIQLMASSSTSRFN